MATQAEIARHLDLSTTRLRDLMNDGAIEKSSDIDAVRISYIRHLRSVASGRRSEGGSLDLTDERAKLAAVQREKIEFDLAEKRRELIPLAEHESALVAHASEVAQKLRALPSRASLVLAEIDDPAVVEERLRGMIEESCDAIAEALASWSRGDVRDACGDLEEPAA